MEEPIRDLKVRRIQADDAADVIRIQSAITKAPVTIDFWHMIEDQVRKGEDASFVAVIDGKVVGYMISYIVFGGFGLEKGAWIATLGVDPKFMGQGIGKKLAEEILAVYRTRESTISILLSAGILLTFCPFSRHSVLTEATLSISGRS